LATKTLESTPLRWYLILKVDPRLEHSCRLDVDEHVRVGQQQVPLILATKALENKSEAVQSKISASERAVQSKISASERAVQSKISEAP
jgi:hypothetical protein